MILELIAFALAPVNQNETIRKDSNICQIDPRQCTTRRKPLQPQQLESNLGFVIAANTAPQKPTVPYRGGQNSRERLGNKSTKTTFKPVGNPTPSNTSGAASRASK
jgi:hypothetical protein